MLFDHFYNGTFFGDFGESLASKHIRTGVQARSLEMFPVTATPSSTSTYAKNENYPISTPLNQVYPPEPNNSKSSPNIRNITAAPPSTAAKTYKTRERLYYETDYVKLPNSPSNTGNNLPTISNTASSTLFEPFLRKQSQIEEVNTEELPPTASLYEFLSGSIPNNNNNIISQTPASTSPHFSNLCTGSPMVINGVIGSPIKSCVNPNLENISTQWSSSFVGGGPQQMTRSVTIFGFPPNCRNEILVSFQSHGSIESFDAASNENSGGSNWIHIVYESEWAAQKALSRNGSIFQPAGVMIGVIPMQAALEKVNMAADSFMTPLKKSTNFVLESDASNKEQSSIFLKKDKTAKYETSETLSSLPDESSLVTKAVNYIFGW